MIDFHSHIIPGIDDGAKNEEMALAMVKMAAANGTTKIIATPHYMRGRFETPRKEVEEHLASLRNLIKKENIPIEIYSGQEVYYSENILEYYNEGEIGTIENTRYMLVELPLGGFNVEKVLDTLYELQIKGIVIILAHPERYTEFIKNPQLINKFLKEGFLFQLNTGSIVGDFGKSVKKTAEIFLKHNMYSVIGSDGHRVEYRNTNMRSGVEALEKLQIGISKGYYINMEKILRDEEVKSVGKFIKDKNDFKGLIKRIFNK